jgi:hypothetical protein
VRAGGLDYDGDIRATNYQLQYMVSDGIHTHTNYQLQYVVLEFSLSLSHSCTHAHAHTHTPVGARKQTEGQRERNTHYITFVNYKAIIKYYCVWQTFCL